MKVFIDTIGCRFNQVETAEMQGLLEENGYTIVRSLQQADIYIINSCTVTQKSDSKSRQAIRKVSRINKSAFIVITGCYAQMNKDEAASLLNVDLVLGNDKKLEIVKHLQELHIGKKRKTAAIKIDPIEKNTEFKSYTYSDYKNHSRGFVKIQTGCNNKCSYCIVTLARGRSRSAPISLIKNQIELLVAKGFFEIVLTGVHIGSYGYDLTPKTDLFTLLESLITIDGLERIRLSSLSPLDITDQLISLVKTSGKICRHFHISLQSGDDEILKSMKRNYTASDVRVLINKICSEIPDICIGADVIVGFPGETEERFNNTLTLISELPVNYLHVFRFSPRLGTDAYNLLQTVSEPVKKIRSKLLKSLSSEKFIAFKKGQVGISHHIVVESKVVESKKEKKTKLLKGLTDNYISVLIDFDDSLINKLVQVDLTGIQDNNVYGRIL